MITAGSRVLCVDSRFSGQVHEWGDDLPREGHIYTVIRIAMARHGMTGLYGKAYQLRELHNPLPSGGQLLFSAWRFRECEMTEDTAETADVIGALAGPSH